MRTSPSADDRSSFDQIIRRHTHIPPATIQERPRSSSRSRRSQMCLAPAASAAVMEIEELQEADVLWPDYDDHHQDHCHCHGNNNQRRLEAARNSKPQQQQQPRGDDDAPRGGEDEARRRRRAGGSTSAPVGIRAGTTTGGRPASWAWSYDSDEGAAAFVPPHVLLAARRRCPEGRAASSVCVGQGRTLKGRDLQSVRTAVLRMTGYLES